MGAAAFFDLDGTLLTVNSAALWLRRERRLGRVGKRQIARALLFFAAYRFSVVDIERAMHEALSTVKGASEESIRAATREWYRDEVAPRAAPGAFEVVERHRRAGDRLVLLTSSSPYASACAVEQFGLETALCTRFEVVGGLLTGEVVKPYCFGVGKVTLAEEYAAREGIDLAASAFYTDSYTDLPMLERVGHPQIVQPDPRLRWEARRRHWPVLDWSTAPAPRSVAG